MRFLLSTRKTHIFMLIDTSLYYAMYLNLWNNKKQWKKIDSSQDEKWIIMNRKQDRCRHEEAAGSLRCDWKGRERLRLWKTSYIMLTSLGFYPECRVETWVGIKSMIIASYTTLKKPCVGNREWPCNTGR